MTNTGPVVPASVIERLLEPFRRLGSDRATSAEGVGLGLSIVRAVATAHGAAFMIDPLQAGGLQIEIAFPRVANHTPVRPLATTDVV